MNNTWILILISLIGFWYLFFNQYRGLKKEHVSSHQSYYVLDQKNSKDASKLLHSVVEDATKLVKHLQYNYPNNEGVQLLVKRFNPNTISEGNPHHKDFTYTENKGEKMVICLRNQNMSFHDKNLIMFPLIHELSHLCDPNYDNSHGKTFRGCFKFFLDEAQKIGIINKPDYDVNPKPYCGMVIKSVV